MTADPKMYDCPALIAIKAISGKWKTRVLWLLRDGPHHFGELRAALPGVSAKVLSEQLGQLKDDAIISSREEMRDGVLYVLYAYSDYGRGLIPVLDQLGAWGHAHQNR